MSEKEILIRKLIELEGRQINFTRSGADGIFTPFEIQEKVNFDIAETRKDLKDKFNWEPPTGYVSWLE